MMTVGVVVNNSYDNLSVVLLFMFYTLSINRFYFTTMLNRAFLFVEFLYADTFVKCSILLALIDDSVECLSSFSDWFL